MPYGMKSTPVTEKATRMYNKTKDNLDNTKMQDIDDGPVAVPAEPIINPLRNEIVVVRFIERDRGITHDKEGDFFGGMGSRSEWPMYVPNKRGSSELMNPLTKSEKAYFESVLGRDLGIYPKNGEPCYWMTGSEGSWNRVVLKKSGLVLNLTNIRDYFYYKILLLHKELVASSLEELENSPRATQLFYMTSEKAELENKSQKANMKYEAYVAYGKWKENAEILKYLIFMMDNREEGPNVGIDMLQVRVMSYIDNDLIRFTELISDKMLETKALLIAAARKKVVLYDGRTGFFYVKDTHQKMCLETEEPRLSAAARWINMKENSDLLLEIQKKTRL